MGDISTERLKEEMNAILMVADLSVITGRKVREQVEKKLSISLAGRKKEVDEILMELIKRHQKQESGGSDGSASASSAESEPEKNSSDDNSSSSEEEYNSKGKNGKKRSQPTQRKAMPKNKKKRKSINAQDSGSESDGGSDSDYEIPKKQPATKKKSGAGSGRKSTGFTRAYNLSPELSAFMGAEASPRHEVVKKVWAIIKERNLYDPKNKQFAICDEELIKVMKVKRFRTFGMLKHLKPHFLN